MGKLDNKVAIVTGAGQGVGRGIALAFAKEGATVIVAEINEDTANSTAVELRNLGAKAMAINCDVSKREDVDKVVQTTVDEYGAIDILVNNAQSVPRPSTPFVEITQEDWDLTLGSGLMGTFYFMKACFPHMKGRGGKIINFASGAGTQRMVGFTPYSATKEAIRAITGVAAREWGKQGINVNVVCPAANSPGMIQWKENFPEQYKAAMAQIPLGRIGDCEEDIGRTVVFLASSDSDFITGQTIIVDGGTDIHS
ncbi:MAG: SDR family NAD(P)-dependent oxidoreductase [Candidatus Hodarchaeota archaeon]